MPIYEYRCNDCGHEAEVLQKVSDPALTDCPACNRPALVKLISAAGFQLKGTGWYATDFRDSSKSRGASGAKNGDAGKPAESKAETASASEGPTCGGGACACK